jgi:hypothetical protein
VADTDEAVGRAREGVAWRARGARREGRRTSKTVISTGMIMPAWSWVLALYSLQNIMMFTPWRRKGGAGVGEVSGGLQRRGLRVLRVRV